MTSLKYYLVRPGLRFTRTLTDHQLESEDISNEDSDEEPSISSLD